MSTLTRNDKLAIEAKLKATLGRTYDELFLDFEIGRCDEAGMDVFVANEYYASRVEQNYSRKILAALRMVTGQRVWHVNVLPKDFSDAPIVQDVQKQARTA